MLEIDLSGGKMSLIDQLEEIEKELLKDPDNQDLLRKKILKNLEIAGEKIYQNSEEAKGIINQCYDNAVQNNYIYGQAKSYHLWGMLAYFQMKFKSAIECYEKALDLYQQCESKVELAHIFNNLGLVFTGLNNFEEAISAYQKALVIYKKHPFDVGESNTYNNLGIVYKYLKKYRKAITFYKKDLQIALRTDNKRNLARSYNNLAAAYAQIKNFPNALDAIKKSIQFHKELKNNNGLVFNYLINGHIYFELKDFKKSISMLDQAQRLAKKLENKKAIWSALEMKAMFYTKTGKLAKAIYYFKKYNQLTISIFTEENAQKLAEIQALIEQKETEKNAIMATAIATSHELRQPLMILQGNIEMMQFEMENKGDFEKYGKYHKKMSDSIERIQDILLRLTEFNSLNYEEYTDDVKMIKL